MASGRCQRACALISKRPLPCNRARAAREDLLTFFRSYAADAASEWPASDAPAIAAQRSWPLFRAAGAVAAVVAIMILVAFAPHIYRRAWHTPQNGPQKI
ncbi:MAG: hypothetical protein WKF30_01130 [Pyrinomonadaceae bacterium]